MSFYSFVPSEAEELKSDQHDYDKRRRRAKPPKFEAKANPLACFYTSDLRGKLGLVGRLSNKKHLTLLIRQGKSKTSIGFYPKNSYMLYSLYEPQEGELWSPDPLFNPDKPSSIYREKMDNGQCEIFNHIFQCDKCKIMDGNTSSSCKNVGQCEIFDRFECPTGDKYRLIANETTHNCITWLLNVFPGIKNQLIALELI